GGSSLPGAAPLPLPDALPIGGFAKSLAQELDFCVEARNIARFHRNFEGDPKVSVPKVYDALSTSEVLCMEFIDGRKFSEVLQSGDRKSTRLNSSHVKISYAVF